MASISAIRQALATQISTYVQPVIETVIAVPLDQIPDVPAVLIFPGKPLAKYAATLGGPGVMGGSMIAATDFNLQAAIVVSRSSTIDRVQTDLDQWLGFENFPGSVSVPAAVEMDPTLGGVVDWCIPTQVASYGPIEYNANMYFGARIDFTVSAE